MTTDETHSIHTLWETMARAWASADAALFASNFSPDCDFTSVRGDKPPGRAGVEAAHDGLFRTLYAATRLDARIIAVRRLRPDLATVEAESTVTRTADGTTLATTHALAVVERTATGAWQITAFHNMIPATAPKEARPVKGPEPEKPPVTATTATSPESAARPKLRHLAIVARDPEKLAAFYTSIFSMELFHRDPDGSCFLSDGYLSLALIKHRLDGDTPLGMNHFGFHISDTETTSAALVEAGADKPAERFTDRPFAEYRAMDPEGNWFDLSEHGFGGPRPPSTADKT
ncbi:SgcJ/EcaC family oxidoreductase [Streptomyces sp. NPDC059837]|uniref:SgcJ/EcaC family oxidoreductase n=1 Tax=unclassified Streptomyces TaxID=2593676 RepID=UPI0022510523|nr:MULTISPECIES: SgcJ/EcaC family oxidoreductase [unclassified Streptomyces]MCX4408985.1 SgcJ/EcaC family oxidoreductase [Streptomyces sp. NBC_01764]MCX5185491.1 SgcJ/EcaC family oxidoreductase [Streptomyces sp. NBC_00268]